LLLALYIRVESVFHYNKEKPELRNTFPLRKCIFQLIYYSIIIIIIIIIIKSSLYPATFKNRPTARRVSVANRVR
jgi:hypothetical protein